jgi:chromosome partitioning protein
MTVPILTLFNNKGGVGKTSLIYHLASMMSDIGHRVLACDLDPQANLTAMFLEEGRLEAIYTGDCSSSSASTIFRCVKPLMQVGDLQTPRLQEITTDLRLIPGDLALAGFEDTLSAEWPNALGSSDLYRPFRILTAFSTIMQSGAQQMEASIILADVGPNLGAINRSALIATDYVVVPLGADLFSLQGLRNLGPTLKRWRQDWRNRKENWPQPEFELPEGRMAPIGYVVQQHSVRLSRPVKAYDKWVNRMPEEYARSLLEEPEGPYAQSPDHDGRSLATVKHYRSLVPMAQEARKPIFKLTSADGAIGGHAASVSDAYTDFRELALRILGNMDNATSEIPM